MLRSELRLTTSLFVAQAAVSNHTGLIARSGLAMPAAPFGSPAWQLPALLSYLHRLHQDEEDPLPRTVARAHRAPDRPGSPAAHPLPG
ncbi:hypothetical protein [Streptomyces sp. NPDC001604]|uniref:hypothetical protein n=1 Tax=Streptomyces sp. NPDC001604 TaxID=3364593 RepID=UPI00367A716E